MEKKKNITNLGRYLYTERINRKEASITNYLQKYDISISESYYRDLETGRKVARIDTGKNICKTLELEPNEFFYYLLKDLLPHEVFENLIKPSQKPVFDSVIKQHESLKLEYERTRKAFENKLADENIFQVREEIVDYLSRNLEILPIIHYMYLRRSCSYEDLKVIIERNDISMEFDSLLNDLKRYQLAHIDEKNETVRRKRRIFKIPRTPNGLKFKNKFFMHENELSTKNVGIDKILAPNNTFIHSIITCLDPYNGGQHFVDKVSELIAASDSGETDLESDESIPFYISVVVSSREKYDTKNLKLD